MLITTKERQHTAALITKVRRGQCEFLSALELAAVMPFETHRAAVKLGCTQTVTPVPGAGGAFHVVT